ncbi:MAG: hypothetical protein CM15mP75_6150 [Flammeovirgaceae bacterium]|nr:MAG: hypothetical protein CM15mP75_6150 [Flammeovirgaceae bacterium]
MTKAMGQELVMSTDGIDKVSINPTSILGKYDFKPSRLGKVVKTLYAGKLPFLVNGGLMLLMSKTFQKQYIHPLKMEEMERPTLYRVNGDLLER